MAEASELEFKKVAQASMILMISLALSSIWAFYYYFAFDAHAFHPLVYLKDGTRGMMHYRTHLYWTALGEIVCTLSYLMAKGICPIMNFGKLGNLWTYYYFYLAAKIVDFILTNRTSDFRIYTTILFIVVQLYYVGWCYIKAENERALNH